MTTNRLARLEDRIQHLVEGGLAHLLAGRLHPRELASQLERAMEDHAIQGDRGQRVAPDVYTVRLNPDDQRAVLETSPDLIPALADELIEMARRSNLTLVSYPQLKLLADSSVAAHRIQITASHSTDAQESTESMQSAVVWRIKDVSAPSARLIVRGEQSITFDRPVINLGRHRDNHIIIDDPGVSRHHAQIRLRLGHYVLFDLGSTAGTTINGQSVQEAVLQSGDVIMLASASLIYVEEENTLPGKTEGADPDTRSLPSQE